MTRRTLQSMTDEELRAERRALSNTVGTWAADRYRRILDEEIFREEGVRPERVKRTRRLKRA
jgi:hypothetical protein